MFNVHAFSETWLKKDLFFSTGYSFADLHDTFSGSRIYGDDYNVGYTPNPGNGLGYTSLNGGANEQTHVGNVNLMATPVKNLTIVPSLRVESDTWNANSGGTGTSGTDTQPYSGDGNGEMLDVRERLDVRYTGVTNWVFSAGGEWTEGSGNLYQTNGLYTVNGSPDRPPSWPSRMKRAGSRNIPSVPDGIPSAASSLTPDTITNGTNTTTTIVQDSTSNLPANGNTYPAYLTMQNFQTYDGNARLSSGPFKT